MSYLNLEQVSKQYGTKTAVQQINFQVERGEIFGLLGGNGAGKTTTMRMILGLISHDAGDITYNGKVYDDTLLKKMGYLPEERGLYPKVKVSEQLTYLAQLKGMSRKQADKDLKAWLERFGVPENYDRKMEELSKGNQQKIQFIAAVLHRPALLILDEAFSGLDPVNVELLKKTVQELRDEGTCIVFSTHRMEHVEELCKQMLILHQSNTLLQGNIKEIKAQFPKEQVRLVTAAPLKKLEQIDGVQKVEQLQNGYKIKMDREETAKKILHYALDKTDIHHFEIMQPTLHDIFVNTVGGEQ
ncbi:ABC transporter ATP-binding protein [Longirhabdus pacifica]|uniref:ABC transporter ATP-binding protein n=1 Tax=Longirhabdus pacifica TaxID=2305227 RepID=UPI001008B3F3|nr:ATP-binding cassette domain-containing protein [Longirhabdus pacifica]